MPSASHAEAANLLLNQAMNSHCWCDLGAKSCLCAFLPSFLLISTNDKSSEKSAGQRFSFAWWHQKLSNEAHYLARHFHELSFAHPNPQMLGLRTFGNLGNFHTPSGCHAEFSATRTNWPLCAVMELLSRLIWLWTWWQERWEVLAGNYSCLLLISKKKCSSKNF